VLLPDSPGSDCRHSGGRLRASSTRSQVPGAYLPGAVVLTSSSHCPIGETMTDTFDVTIDVQDPDFFKALEDPEGFLPYLGQAMQNILTVYQSVAEVYAPESDANSPGRFDQEGRPMGYYERGRGWWYPLLTHNTLGLKDEIPTLRPHSKAPVTMKSMALMALGFPGVAGYRLIPNSEQMHDRWVWEVIFDPSEVIGNLSNIASYSSYVQGLDQVQLHQSRGWRTVMNSWEDPSVQSILMDETMKAVDAYYGSGV
jgi:hypothetical protein